MQNYLPFSLLHARYLELLNNTCEQPFFFPFIAPIGCNGVNAERDTTIPVIITSIRSDVTVYDTHFDLIVKAGKLNIAIDIVNDHCDTKVMANENARVKLIPYLTFNIAPLCNVITANTDQQKIDTILLDYFHHCSTATLWQNHPLFNALVPAI